MNTAEKLEAVKKWQTCKWVHPMTCSLGHTMDPILIGAEVVLICPDCGTTQKDIPEMCFHPPRNFFLKWKD